MPSKAAEFIQQWCSGIQPRVGIVLGSGLGVISQQISNAHTISYLDIPEFPPCGIVGHAGHLHLGYLHDTPIACLEGRAHLYEGISPGAIKIFIRTLKQIGCHSLLVTNAAGSLNRDIRTGSLVLISDHINLQFTSPLVGPNDDEFGPRFVSMDQAYDPTLQEQFLEIAQQQQVPLTKGIFAGVLGPSFETPAEIQMLKRLGADVIGMSLIPEVLVARHCGLRVAAISAVSNLAAGLHSETLSHERTLKGVEKATQKLATLVSAFFKHYRL